MREKHGIAGARKIATNSDDTQAVVVTDGIGEVRLSLSTSLFPAGLTPDEANFIARQLMASAKRARAVGLT